MTSLLSGVFFVVGGLAEVGLNLYVSIARMVLAVLIELLLKMVNVWQKFVIFGMGKLQSVRDSGWFAIFPLPLQGAKA
ncbi:hypothetical protein [Oleiagrimonas sp.]|jgi:hypothetical protein|uniref:hypothetical protein n=1 Tax=Oleiagrimonas sp. TaxID=2010330 RepID=UPI00262BDC98|nr:hypothetical protein [Oleiagrimonas sp.]MDA3913099.1 hypothetical protein [Oleiagrimonas sp.]